MTRTDEFERFRKRREGERQRQQDTKVQAAKERDRRRIRYDKQERTPEQACEAIRENAGALISRDLAVNIAKAFGVDLGKHQINMLPTTPIATTLVARAILDELGMELPVPDTETEQSLLRNQRPTWVCQAAATLIEEHHGIH